MNPTPAAPDALLLIAPGCAHCPVNLEGLAQLVKEGAVGRLEVVNIAIHPRRAAALGVRSVPWTRIGPFELEGVLSVAELREWAQHFNRIEGMAAYFDALLKRGRRDKVEEMIKQDSARLHALVNLVSDREIGIHTRLGIGAVLEELHGSGVAARIVTELGALTVDPDPRTRQDACHYLGLTESPAATSYLRSALNDQSPEVRDIAREALATLAQTTPRRTDE